MRKSFDIIFLNDFWGGKQLAGEMFDLKFIINLGENFLSCCSPLQKFPIMLFPPRKFHFKISELTQCEF